MSTMRDSRHNNLLFNSFVVTVVLAHLTQLVWNLPHPLLPQQNETEQQQQQKQAGRVTPEISPFDEGEDVSSESSGPTSGSNNNSGESGFKGRNGGRNNKETREIHDRPIEVGPPVCSLFQTLLDPRNCRLGGPPPPPRHFPLDDGPESFIDGNRHHNEENLYESNNIGPPHNNGDYYHPHHHNHPPQHHNYHSGPYHGPYDNDDQADSRLDGGHHHQIPPQHIPLDENGNEDETKIIRSKTMIIVPERTCPPGKRRDIRGYCRTVYRFQQQPQPYGSQPARGGSGPVRYYYRRFVAVPTLHFILP